MSQCQTNTYMYFKVNNSYSCRKNIVICFAASDIFLIDNVTSEIRLLRDLDREQDTDMIKLDVKCDINFMKKDINYVNEGMINVHVADVNDNPPMFHNTLTQQINAGKLVSVIVRMCAFLSTSAIFLKTGVHSCSV